jgi:hypothetical protein
MEPFLVGDTVAGETWSADASGRDLLAPSGKAAPARADVMGERMRVIFQADATGFYHLPGADGRDLLSFAVNPDPEQSDLRVMDPSVLPDRADGENTSASFVGNTTDYHLLLRGKPVFHWFILAALAFLLIEGVLFKSSPRAAES